LAYLQQEDLQFTKLHTKPHQRVLEISNGKRIK